MASDYFLELEGVDGESTDDKHKGQIEIESWSWGETQKGAGSRSTSGAAAAGRVSVQDVNFTKKVDKATPLLFKKCADGTHIKKGTLRGNRATGDKQKYMEIVFHDVYVSSYQIGGSSGGEDLPVEAFTLNPGKIEFIYTELDHKTGKSKGDVTKWWDRVTNKGG